jgi:Fe-S-cluster containining protein
MGSLEFDCTTCGACCTSEVYGGGVFVTVYGEDGERFGPSELDPESQGCDALRTVRHDSSEVRCMFLRGTLGASCQCTAYDRRPQVCRDFTAGSPECIAARKLKLGL